MIIGHIDAVTSSGYIEGWATTKPDYDRPLRVAVLNGDGEEIAWGLAHLYREDLAEAGQGGGWCAFRLWTSRDIGKSTLVLLERETGFEIHRSDDVPFNEDGVLEITSVPKLIESDPTVINSINQLWQSSDKLTAFIKARGVEAFVRAGYIYVLGRPADLTGLQIYGRMIRKHSITPFSLLQTLFESDEFRARPRQLAAPNTAGFPFDCH